MGLNTYNLYSFTLNICICKEIKALHNYLTHCYYTEFNQLKVTTNCIS